MRLLALNRIRVVEKRKYFSEKATFSSLLGLKCKGANNEMRGPSFGPSPQLIFVFVFSASYIILEFCYGLPSLASMYVIQGIHVGAGFPGSSLQERILSQDSRKKFNFWLGLEILSD